MISKKMENMVANSSAIRAMFEEGNRLAKIYGPENVFDFSLGNPNVPAPKAVKQAILDILDEEDELVLHGYTNSNAGYEDVRQAVAESLNERFGTAFAAKNITMTVGAAGGLNVILKALLNPGDEVLIPQPSYVSYLPCVTLADGVPVIIELEEKDQFKLTPEKLLEKITDKTKILVLPFPNNPTGAIMEKHELEEIAKIVIEKDLFVVTDEIYSELTYQRKHATIAAFPGMKERTVLINGFSKSYAMTGWRLGYACGPAPIIKIMTKIHQSAIMSAPTTSQYAAITALKECDGEIDRMRDEYNMRRRLVVKSFNDMGLTCFEPRGAFYAFPCIKSTGMSSQDFCTKLLEQKHVAIIPGDAFGASGEGYARISYAYSVEHLKEALRRIREFLQENGIYHGI